MLKKKKREEEEEEQDQVVSHRAVVFWFIKMLYRNNLSILFMLDLDITSKWVMPVIVVRRIF